VAAGENGSAGAAAVWLCGRVRPLGAASLNGTKWKQEAKAVDRAKGPSPMARARLR
jgi:hypothetical protein